MKSRKKKVIKQSPQSRIRQLQNIIKKLEKENQDLEADRYDLSMSNRRLKEEIKGKMDKENGNISMINSLDKQLSRAEGMIDIYERITGTKRSPEQLDYDIGCCNRR